MSIHASDGEWLLTHEDIAELAGITVATSRSYASRGWWGEPDARAGQTPLWRESTVRARLAGRVGPGRPETTGLWTVETDAGWDQATSVTGAPVGQWSRAGRLGLTLTAGVRTATNATVALRRAGRTAWLTPGPGRVPGEEFAYVASHPELEWDAERKGYY